jgi:DNA-binding CsgD family transcriptional regulator
LIGIFRPMEILTFTDQQHLHRSIQKIYTLHNANTFGLDALSIVNQLVPSDIPSFHSTDMKGDEVSLVFQPDFVGLTPEMITVVHEYFGEHPIVQNMPQALNSAHTISDFINQQEFYCLEGLYQQYLKLFDIEDQMVCFLPPITSVTAHHDFQPGITLAGFSLNRSERNFTERDRTMLNLLRPHLSQAYANAQRYETLQQDLHQVQQSLNCLGLVILNTEGRVQSIAPQAKLWLERYFTKNSSPDRLPDHLWSWTKHQIKSLTDPSDPPKACPTLRTQLTDRELTVRLVLDNQNDRYLLLLEEQRLDSIHSLELLGLSQRETELLNWVMTGKDNKTIAEAMGITVATVRKHLENLYRKLNVKSRSEAIAQTLNQLGIRNSPSSN